MQSSKILLKDGQIVDLVDGRINDGDIDTWNNKLNVEITSPNGTINVQSSTDVQTNTKTFDLSVNTAIIATNGDLSDLESQINHKLDSKEDVSNKIQVVHDSSTVEYPSSKAVADFVNSSVATNTATFLGNFSLEDLGLTYPATEVQIASALNSHTWPTGYPTNNDYVYVEISNPQSSIYDKVQRYKYRVSVASWGYEYTLNNSSFTAEEMAAIDSGITSQDVTNLRVDHTTLGTHVDNTGNPHKVTKSQVGLGNVDNTSDADKPVSTAQQNALNKKLDKTGDASNTTATFTKNSGDTSSVTSGSKLSAIFTAISSFFASLKALAFKDKVSDSDINGTISDSHIASSSTWNSKYTKPSTGIPKTDLASGVQASLGKADSALQIHQSVIDNKPTLSWGAQSTVGTVGDTALHVTMPSADSDTFYVSANSTSFADALAALNANKKLLLRVGKPGSGAYSTSYYLPLYRVQFNGNTITEFVWMLDSDAYGDASGSNTYGAIYLYKLNDSGWSNSSDNVHYALAAGTAYGGVADYLKFQNYSEINFKNNSTTLYKDEVWFNYRNGDTEAADPNNQIKDYYFGDRNKGTNTTLHANRLVGSADSADSAKSVNATVGNSIISTGTNGSMEILNGALSSSGGGGGSCSIDGDGISFTKGVGGSSMTADGISTAGTGTFTGGAKAKGRQIDGSATILTNKSSITWNSEITNLVVNRSAGLTTTIDLKNLLSGVVYWLHVPRDNIIALWNSSAISTFYCYDSSLTMKRTTDTYDIRSHIRGGERDHGGFSTAIVRNNSNFYVMMDY